MTVTRYPEGATSLDGLGDVAVSTAARGQIIAHNGTLFRNRSQGVRDVRDWGVVGDGATNDAAAINSLLQTDAVDGDTIVFPAADYLIASQLTWTGKRLTLDFAPGARLVESGSITTPLLYLTNCDRSVVRGLTVAGSETTFVGGDSTRWAVMVEASDEVVIERLAFSGKSRGIRLDTSTRVRVDGVSATGLIHATQLNGAITAADTTLTVDSTTGFPTSGTLKCGNEEITYSGTTSTTFTGCTRGANSTTAATHADDDAVVEWVANRNYHNAVYCWDVTASHFGDIRVRDIGNAYVQGGTSTATAGKNSIVGVRALNCYDNGVYCSSGDETGITDAVVVMETGKRQVIGGAGIKVRGSRYRIVGGGAVGTYNGVALSGAGESTDAYGASGAGITVSGFTAKACRGPGVNVSLITGIVSNSPLRDCLLQGVVVDGCEQDGEAAGSVHLVGGIGIHLDACKVIDHGGSPASSGAIMIAGNASPVVTAKRTLLTDCEVIWPDSSPPATRSVQITRADDTQINNLLLVNTNNVGVDMSTNTNRTKVRGTRIVNATTSSVTLFPSTSTAVDSVIELFEGMAWVDSGTTTRVIWAGKRVLDITAAYTLTAANYDGVEIINAGGSGAAYTVTLPLIARSKGRRLVVKRTHATQNITVDGSGAETIDGAATKRIDTQYGWIELVGGSSEWHLIASGGTIT